MLSAPRGTPAPISVRVLELARNSRGLLRKGVLAATDQTLISGSNFLINVLLARWLGARQYGIYSLTYSVFLFLTGFHNSLLVEPMAVFGPARFRGAIADYVRRLVTLHIPASVVLALCGVVVIEAVVRPVPREVLLVIGPVFVLVPLFWMLRRAAYLQPDARVGPTAALIYNVVAFSVLAVVRWAGALGMGTAFLTQSMGALAASGYLLWVLRPTTRAEHADLGHASIVRIHWDYGVWACATNVVYWLTGEAYVALIGVFLRVEDIAALRALQNLTAPVPQLVSALSMLLLPQASLAFADQGIRGLQRLVTRTLALVTAGAAGYFLFLLFAGGRLMTLLYGAKYDAAAYLLPWVAASSALTVVAQALLLGLRGMQQASSVFRAYVAASVVTVVAGAALTKYFGLWGAVVGVLLTSLALAFALVWQYRLSVGRMHVVA